MDNVTTVDFTANAHFTEISEMTGSTTIQAASTGMVDPTQGVYTTSYWVDLPVFNQAAYNVPVVGFPAYVPTTSASGSFLRAELETGGYKTLDPAPDSMIFNCRVYVKCCKEVVGKHHVGTICKVVSRCIELIGRSVVKCH